MKAGEDWDRAVLKVLELPGADWIEKLREISRLLNQSHPIGAITLREKALDRGAVGRKARKGLKAMGWTPPSKEDMAHAKWVEEWLEDCMGDLRPKKPALIAEFDAVDAKRREVDRKQAAIRARMNEVGPNTDEGRELKAQIGRLIGEHMSLMWIYAWDTRSTVQVLRRINAGSAADQLELAEFLLRRAHGSECHPARASWVKAMSRAIQTLPPMRGLKLALNCGVPFSCPGGDFQGYAGPLPRGCYNGASFRGAVIPRLPPADDNSFRKADFMDAALPMLIEGDFSGAVFHGVKCYGSPGPLSIAGNFSGVDLTRVVVDVAAMVDVVLRGASITPKMFESIFLNVPMPNLAGIRGPGAKKVLDTIALVNRVIDEVAAPLEEMVPGLRGLAAQAREKTAPVAAQGIKRHLDHAKEDRVLCLDRLYEVINDVNAQFKALIA